MYKESDTYRVLAIWSLETRKGKSSSPYAAVIRLCCCPVYTHTHTHKSAPSVCVCELFFQFHVCVKERKRKGKKSDFWTSPAVERGAARRGAKGLRAAFFCFIARAGGRRRPFRLYTGCWPLFILVQKCNVRNRESNSFIERDRENDFDL